MSGSKEIRTSQLFDRLNVFFVTGLGHAAEKGFTKHSDPVGEAAFAVFELSGAIEERGFADFQAVVFEQDGILGEAWVLPGTGAVGCDT